MFINKKGKSLYSILGINFFIAVIIISIIHLTFNYFTTKKQLEDIIVDNIKVSSLQLKNSLIPFIESYQITDYESLIKHEMQHNNLKAIVVEDFLTGKILGDKSYITGIYKDDKLKFNIIDSENINTLKLPKKAYLKKVTNLINNENEQIARLSIYGTDYFMNEELKNILLKGLFINFFVYSIIAFLFYSLIKTILIKPINNIISSLSYKEDGVIFFNKSNEFSSKEFSFLSSSINEMTEKINVSHKELKESELRWQFAVNGRGDGLWDWNIKTNEVYFSKRWKEMLGYSENEITASLKEWKKIIHPDDLKQVYIDVQKYIKGKTQTYSNEHRVKCKDGTFKWILDRGIIVEKDENGHPIRLVGTHTDISERKESEYKMKQALTVYENIAEGIIMTDANNRIINVNPSFCKTTGYSFDEVIGKKPSFLRADEKEIFYDSMWDEIREKGFWQGEVTNRKKNGELYEEYLSINVVKSEDGTITSYIGIFSDISLLKEQERLLAEQAKLASMGEMIGNIAHQWRQPLNTISITASSLGVQNKMEVLSTEDIDKYTDTIIKTTQYLSKTIEIFRSFIKGNNEAKGTLLKKEITEALFIVDNSIKNNHIDFYNNTNDTNEIFISLVEGQLTQVLINIFNNAKDALLSEKVSNPWIKLDLERVYDHIIITIEDNAGGIPDKVLPHIFEPYFTTKHQSQGTGLGLHMSYRIVTESLNGNIYVKNTKHGAKFYIELKV